MPEPDEQPEVTEPERLLSTEQRLEQLEAMLKEALDLLRREAGSGRLGHD